MHDIENGLVGGKSQRCSNASNGVEFVRLFCDRLCSESLERFIRFPMNGTILPSLETSPDQWAPGIEQVKGVAPSVVSLGDRALHLSQLRHVRLGRLRP